MQLPPGQRFNRIHNAALAAGLKVSRCQQLGQTELFEYDRALGTYVHMAFLDGCFHVEAPFEEVLAKWGSTDCHLPVWPVNRIEIDLPAEAGAAIPERQTPVPQPCGFPLSSSKEFGRGPVWAD